MHTEEFSLVSGMTFPAYRALLADCLENETHEDAIALVARNNCIPVGLLLLKLPLGSRSGGKSSAELVSVFVSSVWRQRGVGRQLMLSAEDELRRRAHKCLTANYTTRMPEWKPFEMLLASCKWSQPEAGLLMAMAHLRELMKAPWLKLPLTAPTGFEVFEWSHLSNEEKSQLRIEVINGEIPHVLSPFPDSDRTEPSLSVGVRHQGKVVAWMIVTRSSLLPDVLTYRSLFVRPRFHNVHCLGPLVIGEALRRHSASPINQDRPVVSFAIDFSVATKMVNFYQKRLAPFCFSTYESREAIKNLT